MLAAHGEPTVERMGLEERVLCIQDTTELDFTSQPGIAGLGRLSDELQHGMCPAQTLGKLCLPHRAQAHSYNQRESSLS